MNSPNPATISCHGDRIAIQGPVTIENVVTLTGNGIALLDHPNLTVDLQQVTEVDSTIISMLLEWLRAARQKGYELQVINMPASLTSLIQLYGIVELIPVATPQPAGQSDT